MIDPELGFDKKTFIGRLRVRKRLGLLPKHIIRLAETIPNWSWETYYDIEWCTKKEFIQFCKDNGIESSTQFLNWCRENERPENISVKPYDRYEDWSWGDISGFYHKRDYISKEEFIKWCKDNKIKNEPIFRKWQQKNKKPENIPSQPNKIYNNFEWGDLSGRYRKVDYISKNEFIQWCNDNGITHSIKYEQWKKENKRPKNIPSNPDQIYDDFLWGDISGLYHNNTDWCTKEEFIQWCKDNGIKNGKHFTKWCRENKKPKHITAVPYSLYDNFRWGELSGHHRNVKWVSVNKFIQWCKNNGITSQLSFRKWCRKNIKPDNLPYDPYRVYDNFSWNLIKVFS